MESALTRLIDAVVVFCLATLFYSQLGHLLADVFNRAAEALR